MTPRAQRGASLAELLVGLLIGLLAAVTMLAVFADSEARRRNTTGVADAQQTGLLALGALGVDLANAGNGLAAAARELAACPDTGDIATSLRPIPVLITAGATANEPDSFVVNYGVARASAAAMPFAADAPPGAAFRVRSALGFTSGDAIVAISPDGRCDLTTATSVTQPDAEGVVDIAHARLGAAYPETSVLLDLGPRSGVQRVRYDIVDATLRSLDLVTDGAAPNPIASNIVNMKLQYGIDDDGDGFIDTWVGAGAAPWNPASVLAASAATLARIKAIRIGLIVKSETPDRDVAARYDWVLFDCGQANAGLCPGRITGTLPSKWRYRTYETVIALRNTVWNGRP